MAELTDELDWTVPTPGSKDEKDQWAGMLVDLIDNDIEPDVAEALSGGAGTVTESAADHDGANGGEQILNAIDALPPGGGSVFVPPEGPDANGDWEISDRLEPPDNCHIAGVPGATTLRKPDGSSGHFFALGNGIGGPDARNITIEGFVLDGNRQNAQGSGIWLDGAENITVRDVDGFDHVGYHIIVRLARDVLVENCTARNCGDDNFTITDNNRGESRTRNVRFHDCVSHDADQSGFEIDDGPRNIALVDCQAYGGLYGVRTHTHGGAAEGAPQNLWLVRCVSDGAGTGISFGANRPSAHPPRGYHAIQPTVRNAQTAAITSTPFRAGGTEEPIEGMEIVTPDIIHNGSEAAIAFNTNDGVVGGAVRGGRVQASGAPAAIAINSAASDIHIDDVTLNGGVTDDGTRTLQNGNGTNAGDPSSAGEWNGHGKQGRLVYDTESGRPFDGYRYVNGEWQQA